MSKNPLPPLSRPSVREKIVALVFDLWRGATQALLVAFCVLGLVCTIIIPPFQVPDEPTHWLAAYSRTAAILDRATSRKECSLANSLTQIFEPGRIAFHTHEKVSGRQFRRMAEMQPLCTESTLNYGIVTTYPGTLAARATTTGEANFPHKAFQVFLLSRIFQGIFLLALAWRFAAVAWRTNRLTPGLLVMTAIMTAPLFVQQSFSLSADCITFALSLSLLFFMFHLPKARWFDWVILFVTAITVGATKPPLFAMVPTFLYAGLWRAHKESGCDSGRTCLRSPHAYLAHLCVLLSFCAVIWISLAQQVTGSGSTSAVGGNMQGQINYIFQHPASSLVVIVEAAWNKFSSWEPFIGSLGWLDTHLSGWTQKKYQQLLILALILEIMLCAVRSSSGSAWRQIASNLRWKLPLNALIIACLFGVGVCTALIIYLSWTPVGSDAVHGLQARYFLPMLLPLPLLVGDFFNIRLTDDGGNARSSYAGMIISAAFFGTAALLLLVPLYLDLILRWW